MKTKQPEKKLYKAAWKSEKAERAFRDADAARWGRATSTPPEALDVTTSFGSTRVYRWPGAESSGVEGERADIVLLHGVGDTSIRWVPLAESLSEHNVYAVDIMGDVGGSVPKDGFESGDDYGVWLSEVIDFLGLRAPHIVGHSMGGYVALSHAVRGHSEGSTVLFDPVGVVKLKLGAFVRWGAKTALAYYAPTGLRLRLAERLGQPLLADKADMAVHLKGMKGHPMQLPPLPVFDDEQLAAIRRPVRLVAGENSPPFDVAAMVRRAADRVANCEARVLAGAGHGFVMSHPDECLAEISAAIADASVSSGC